MCTVPSLAAALTGCKVKGASSDHHAEGVAFAANCRVCSSNGDPNYQPQRQCT